MSKKQKIVFWGAVLLCMSSVLLSLCFGAANLTLHELWHAIKNGPSGIAGYIFWYSRLPRTCACLLAGAALSLAGCILQSVLGNKLASPGIIGVNAGAALSLVCKNNMHVYLCVCIYHCCFVYPIPTAWGLLVVYHCSSHRNGWLPVFDASGIFHLPMNFS